MKSSQMIDKNSLDSEYNDIFTAFVISFFDRSTEFKLFKPSMTMLDNSIVAMMNFLEFVFHAIASCSLPLFYLILLPEVCPSDCCPQLSILLYVIEPRFYVKARIRNDGKWNDGT